MTDEQIVELVEKTVFTTVQTLFGKLDLSRIPQKRPKEWSALTVAPYYKEKYALEIRTIADEMMAECANNLYEDRVFYYKDYKDYSSQTLYLKINQARRYLLDNLDPEGKYFRFFEMINVLRIRGTGIKLAYNREMIAMTGPSLVATSVMPPEEQRRTIKDDIDEFLLNPESPKKFMRSKLALTEEEISLIESSLCQLDNVIFKINPGEISIIKLSDEEMKML